MNSINLPTSSFMYIKRIGFIKKSSIVKLILVPLMVFFMFFGNMSATMPSVISDKDRQEIVHSDRDKIVMYAIAINDKLDISTAKILADSILYESSNHDIPVNLLLGLIKVESAFDIYAISNAGAMGLMQVMPLVHRDKLLKQPNKNIYDPKTNIALGTQILDDCFKKHHYNDIKSLQCYNGSTYDKSLKYSKTVIKATPNLI